MTGTTGIDPGARVDAGLAALRDVVVRDPRGTAPRIRAAARHQART